MTTIVCGLGKVQTSSWSGANHHGKCFKIKAFETDMECSSICLGWYDITNHAVKGRSEGKHQDKKVAKMRFQHLSYRWLSDIAFLPPFAYTTRRTTSLMWAGGMLVSSESTVCFSDVSWWYAWNWVDVGSTCAYLAVVDERKRTDISQEQKGCKNAISAFVI